MIVYVKVSEKYKYVGNILETQLLGEAGDWKRLIHFLSLIRRYLVLVCIPVLL